MGLTYAISIVNGILGCFYFIKNIVCFSSLILTYKCSIGIL